MMRITSKAMFAAGVSLIACPVAALAQDAAAPPAASAPAETTAAAPTPAAAPAEAAPGDIVVTANKREQKLNDVGITVAVVTGDNLKERQVNSLADLAQTIPSLTFSNTNNGTPVLTLRGVGFYESSIGSYPAVAVYVDEVPLSFPVLTKNATYDLERVEVLKGPQGTTFGQNATGGALNYIAAKPTKDFHAGVDLTYGRFNQVIGEGYVSGPVIQDVQFRLSGRVERADGWQISNSRPDGPDRTNGKVERYMGRLQIAAQPTDSLRLLASVSGWKDKSDPQAQQLIGLDVQNPVQNPSLTTSLFSPQTPRAADWTPGRIYANNSMWMASLRADLNVTDGITLTSLSSYAHYKQNQGDDGDGTALETLDLIYDRGKINTFSQEVRIANASSNRFRWVVGGNYEKSKTYEIVNLDYKDSSSSYTLATLGYPINSATYDTLQHFRNYAFFGNGEFDLTPKLTAKGGVRYTNTRDNANLCSRDLSGEPNNVGPFFYNVLLGGAFGPYTSNQCFVINTLGYTVGGVAPGAPGAYASTLAEHNVSWKAGLDYKPRPGLLLYVNVAKGYKAGSFPAVSGSTFDQYLPVKQESVLAYEGGFKVSLLDHTLELNGAGYYYDYRDKQLRSKLLALPFGILDVLQNIPKSTVKGFELEATARPTRGFVINTAFTYTNAKIDRFTGINAAGVSANFAGTQVPFTPKFQIGVNADYDFPITDRLNAFVGSSLTFHSKATSVIGGNINPPAAIPTNIQLFGITSYTLVDLRAGIRSHDDRWRVSIWGKNIFNQYYYNNVVAAFDTIGRYTGMPATYGASVGYKF